MPRFQGFRDFMELFIVPPTPETEKMLNEPAPKIGYPKKVKKKQFKQTPGGKVKKGVFTPDLTLGIPRKNMPQLKDRLDFLRWIMSRGVKVERKVIAPESLLRDNHRAFAQDAIYVEKALKKIEKQGVLCKLILLSEDDVIVDGNHHWLALMQVAPRMPLPMFKIYKPFQDILTYAKFYPKVSYEESFGPEGKTKEDRVINHQHIPSKKRLNLRANRLSSSSRLMN